MEEYGITSQRFKMANNGAEAKEAAEWLMETGMSKSLQFSGLVGFDVVVPIVVHYTTTTSPGVHWRTPFNAAAVFDVQSES